MPDYNWLPLDRLKRFRISLRLRNKIRLKFKKPELLLKSPMDDAGDIFWLFGEIFCTYDPISPMLRLEIGIIYRTDRTMIDAPETPMRLK